MKIQKIYHYPLGKFVRHHREKKGYSLRDVEAMTGICTAYLNRVEEGIRKHPPYKVIKALASALDVREDTLLLLSQGDEEQELKH